MCISVRRRVRAREAATPEKLSQEPPRRPTQNISRHLIRQAAESFSSLVVATDKVPLRRPVNAIFRQNTPPSLLPLRSWASHRPTEPFTGGHPACCHASRRANRGMAHPYVSRGPGPVDFRGPRLQDGALGPCTRSSVTASLPTSDSSRPRIDDDISRIWVVHAVESARTVRTPSLKVTGLQCSATSGPTISGQRPITAPTATSRFHPRSSSSRSIWSPSNDGSRPEAAEPGRPLPC
jgi:hypothetical protein